MPVPRLKLLSLAIAALLLAPLAHPQPTLDSLPPLYLGTAWYPEQWPESRWEADLTLMEQAHIRFVRITEFAWSSMEPTEGNYKFDWIDHAIAAAAKHHIYVVLGTPGATPPAWLTQKYPETLRIKRRSTGPAWQPRAVQLGQPQIS